MIQLVIPHAEPVAFVPAGPRSAKLACATCGRTGYPAMPWQLICRRGHAPCSSCGKQLAVLLDGSPRVHTRCPDNTHLSRGKTP